MAVTLLRGSVYIYIITFVGDRANEKTTKNATYLQHYGYIILLIKNKRGEFIILCCKKENSFPYLFLS